MSAPHTPTPEDDPALRETLKHCSPATYYAACKFRATGRREDLRTVLLGIIERFVDCEVRPKLQTQNDALRLSEDLGIDSLTMMEIALIAEDVLALSFSNDDLTHLHSLAEVQTFFASKLTVAPDIRRPIASNTNPPNWNPPSVGEAMRRTEARRISRSTGAGD